MAEKFTDKLKGFISGGYDSEDYEEFDEYEEEEFLPTPPKSSSNKVVNISTNSGKNGQFRVMIYEPTQYNEDIPGIVDSLKNKKVCGESERSICFRYNFSFFEWCHLCNERGYRRSFQRSFCTCTAFC